MPDADDRASQARRGRGRPRIGADTTPLTRERIAQVALELAADRGFPALTMRSLAERLGITVRPLYNHVTGRQDVVDLVAARMMDSMPERRLDPFDWQGSIRNLYSEARDAYRTMGRALLFALDETVTPVEVPIPRILLPERMLAFLTEVGLDLEDALVWRTQFLTDLLGFALLIDYPYDRSDPDERHALRDPVPRAWLDAHPEAPAPLARRATRLPEWHSEDLFDHYVERAIHTAATMRKRTAK